MSRALINEISQIEPNLYLGGYKHVTNKSDEFKKLNINTIISCCKEITHQSNTEYQIENYPIDDGCDASILDYLDCIVDKINQYVSQNKIIYVHCVRSIKITNYYYLLSDEV
jgi:protein-tyrosine phosphatase